MEVGILIIAVGLLVAVLVQSMSNKYVSAEDFANIRQCSSCNGTEFEIINRPYHNVGSLSSCAQRHDICKVCKNCGEVVAIRKGKGRWL